RAQGWCAGWLPVPDPEEPDGEPLPLLGRLIERMRRGLSVRYLVHDEDGAHIAEQTVCGRIEWDASGDGRVPLLVIDSQDISWDEFGRLLMSFEGWQFPVAIRDRARRLRAGRDLPGFASANPRRKFLSPDGSDSRSGQGIEARSSQTWGWYGSA